MFKRFAYVYLGIILALGLFSAYLWTQISYFNGLYDVHSAYINTSGLCSGNETTMMFFYGNNCQSCNAEFSAFVGTTSLFGLWSDGRFYSSYFCAYAVNITAYSENTSLVFAPSAAISLFNKFSTGRVPFITFGNRYYKIGGFNDNSTANTVILEYICKAINSSAPQCT